MSTNRFLIVAALAALLVATLRPASAAAPDLARLTPNRVTCVSCIVVDEEQRALWERAPNRRLPNASTTKMATALVLWDRFEPPSSELVTVSGRAAATGGGGLDLSAGDLYSVSELLYALLLTSSNEAAVALAEHAAGSEARFVRLMNRYVRGIGLDATHFVTAHGLDARGHHSSARDLAAIGSRVVEHRGLAPIVATPAVTIAGPNGNQLLENRNPLLKTYRGAIGVKTGFTEGAGNVLVAAARRHGRTLVAVAMRSADAPRDASLLLDHGFGLLASSDIVEAGETVGELTFAAAGSTPIVVSRAVQGWARPSEVEAHFEPEEAVSLPVRIGERVGRVVVTADGRRVGSAPALAGAGAAAPEHAWGSDLLAGLLHAGYATLQAVGVTSR